MDTVTVPYSVWVSGRWTTAHWAAEVVDPVTGDLVVTATVVSPPHDVVVLRLTMDLVRDLRRLAGFGSRMERIDVHGAEECDCRTNAEQIEALGAELEELGRRLDGLRHASVVLENKQRQVSERLMRGESEAAAAEKALGERVTAMEELVVALKAQVHRAGWRASLGVREVEIRDAYDEDRDDGIVSHWDLVLLEMITNVNDRLATLDAGERDGTTDDA